MTVITKGHNTQRGQCRCLAVLQWNLGKGKNIHQCGKHRWWGVCDAVQTHNNHHGIGHVACRCCRRWHCSCTSCGVTRCMIVKSVINWFVQCDNGWWSGLLIITRLINIFGVIIIIKCIYLLLFVKAIIISISFSSNSSSSSIVIIFNISSCRFEQCIWTLIFSLFLTRRLVIILHLHIMSYRWWGCKRRCPSSYSCCSCCCCWWWRSCTRTSRGTLGTAQEAN